MDDPIIVNIPAELENRIIVPEGLTAAEYFRVLMDVQVEARERERDQDN